MREEKAWNTRRWIWAATRESSISNIFSGLAFPYVGTTAPVDITALRGRSGASGCRFLTVCYCAARAANRVPELRRRILNGGIIEYERCRTSHTVALEDETYCYCTLDCAQPFADYLPYAVLEQERAKAARSIDESEADTGDLIFVSTLPWLSYTSLIQPVPVPADSNPRITFGKFYAQGEKTLLPVSLLCNHALADGLHIAAFYRQLEREIEALCAQA